MENQEDKKFTWVIKNVSTLQSEKIYSDEFVVGGCKWRIIAFPKGRGNNVNYLTLYLDVAESKSLPSGWRRHAKFSFTIVNQTRPSLSPVNKAQHWFDSEEPDCGFTSMFLLSSLLDKVSGFLVNGEVKIVAEVDVLEVIGKLHVPEETSLIEESMDVNGFQVLPSQVKSVNRLFERHPHIALELRPKNPLLRTAYMNILLNLIDVLRKSSQNISKDDLSDAFADMRSLNDVGFKLDWLEKTLNEVSQKKEREEACETRVQELEKELKDLQKSCLDVKALLEKEKAELLDARAPISYDDVF